MKHKITFGDGDTAVLELSLNKLERLLNLASERVDELPFNNIKKANEELINEFADLLGTASFNEDEKTTK